VSEFEGVNIREVWDYRLSTAVPQIDRRAGTWVVKIFAKSNPDYDPSKPETMAKPLEVHDTGIEYVDGDEYDCEKLKICYEWLLSVRDKYALPNIEELKPAAAAANKANVELSEMCKGLSPGHAKLKMAELEIWLEAMIEAGEEL